MKQDDIRSVAQSIADSLASGVSLMTRFFDLRVSEDALRSEDGILIIDLLHGVVVAGRPSADLVAAVALLPREFDRLSCSRGFESKDCRRALASFQVDQITRGFRRVVEDISGRVTETDYEGSPARRVKDLDPLGRRRRRPVRPL